ncbi:hypothetical protein JXM67_07975 [candidate division WOR-3 bacterium]|nr:hypothetical protein [candidate division WOR-3 bacterium]
MFQRFYFLETIEKVFAFVFPAMVIGWMIASYLFRKKRRGRLSIYMNRRVGIVMVALLAGGIVGFILNRTVELSYEELIIIDDIGVYWLVMAGINLAVWTIYSNYFTKNFLRPKVKEFTKRCP